MAIDISSKRSELMAQFAALAAEMSTDELDEAVFLVEKMQRGAQSRVGLLSHYFGLRYSIVERGHIRCEMPVSRRTLNPAGVVHGGAVFTLVDSSMGAAALSVIDVAGGERCATTEAKINFLGAVREGKLIAETVVSHEGRHLVVLESRVTDAHGRLVALATGSCFCTRNTPL